MKYEYFDKPMMVKFIEKEEACDEPHWTGGIAYYHEIICGECGCVVDLDDVEEIIPLSWISISEEIMGE